MRKVYLLLSALLLPLCQLLAQGKAVIVGSITAPLSDHIELITYPNPLLSEEVKTEVPLTGKTFRIEVPVQHAMVAELQHGEEVAQVYLEPGFELELKTSGKSFLKSLKYKGKGANENNCLARYTLRFEEEEEYQALPDNVKLPEKGFIEFLDYRRADQLSNFEKYASKYELTPNFQAFLQAEIDYSYALDILNYHPMRQQMLQVLLSKPSADFYGYLFNLDLDNPENLISPSFLSFLRSYTTYFARESGYTEKSPAYFKVRYDVAEQELQGQVRLVAQAQVLKQSIQQGHLKYTTQLLHNFKQKSTDHAANAYLEKLYSENSTLVAGGLAPDLKLTTLSGEDVSISDFRGNLIYVNFWRSDCGLCHVELPHLQRLTSKLGNHRVVFLNVAVGDNEEQWRQLVQKKELQGEQTLAKATPAEVATQFGLKEVPAYLLLDEEGRFISLKARRPSDHEAANDILQHLQVRQVSLK